MCWILTPLAVKWGKTDSTFTAPSGARYTYPTPPIFPYTNCGVHHGLSERRQVAWTVPWHNHHCYLQMADSNLSFNQKLAKFWKEMAPIPTLTTVAAATDEVSLTELIHCLWTSSPPYRLMSRVGGGKVISTPNFCCWDFFSPFSQMTTCVDRSDSLFSVCKTKLPKQPRFKKLCIS